MRHILAILASVAVCYATIPVVSSGVNYENMGVIATVSSAAAWDTVGGTDSATLINNFIPPDGAEVFYVHDALTGTNAAAATLQVMVDAFSKDGALMFRSTVDTVTAAPGEAIALPFIGGAKYRVKVVGYGSNGAQVIFNRGYFIARRVVEWQKPWQ